MGRGVQHLFEIPTNAIKGASSPLTNRVLNYNQKANAALERLYERRTNPINKKIPPLVPRRDFINLLKGGIASRRSLAALRQAVTILQPCEKTLFFRLKQAEIFQPVFSFSIHTFHRPAENQIWKFFFQPLHFLSTDFQQRKICRKFSLEQGVRSFQHIVPLLQLLQQNNTLFFF